MSPSSNLNKSNEIYRFLSENFPDESFQRDDILIKDISLDRYITNILKLISTYLPALIVEKETNERDTLEPWSEIQGGTLTFVDVSGFTAMSEQLSKLGQIGNEIITRILNSFFTEMIFIVRGLGGSILKFGGDAMTILTPGDPADSALLEKSVLMAQLIQEKMSVFENIKTEAGVFSLSVSIGINAGNFFIARLGERTEYWEPLISGFAVNNTADAETIAEAGQIVVTKFVADKLWKINTKKIDDRFYLISGMEKEVRATHKIIIVPLQVVSEKLEENINTLHHVKPYLMPSVFKRIAINPFSMNIAGEHRPVTIMFVNLLGISELIEALSKKHVSRILNEYFNCMLKIIRKYGGFVNCIDIYNHGDKLLVLFGAPRAIGNAPLNAVLCAISMNEGAKPFETVSKEHNLGIKQRIGINHGPVFCTNTGSPIRKVYTVMGDNVNIAARIMSSAEPSQILISDSVRKNLAEAVMLEELPPIEVKGKSYPLVIFKVTGIRDDSDKTTASISIKEKMDLTLERLDEITRRALRILSVIASGILKTDILEYLKSKNLPLTSLDYLIKVKCIVQSKTDKGITCAFSSPEFMKTVYGIISVEDRAREHCDWIDFVEKSKSASIENYSANLIYHCQMANLPLKRITYMVREAERLCQHGDDTAGATLLEEAISLLMFISYDTSDLDLNLVFTIFSRVEDIYSRSQYIEKLPPLFEKAYIQSQHFGNADLEAEYSLKHISVLLFLERIDEAEAMLNERDEIIRTNETLRQEADFIRARIAINKKDYQAACQYLKACLKGPDLSSYKKALICNLFKDIQSKYKGDEVIEVGFEESSDEFERGLGRLAQEQYHFEIGHQYEAIQSMEKFISERMSPDFDLRHIMVISLVDWYWQYDFTNEAILKHLYSISQYYEKQNDIYLASAYLERLIVVLLIRKDTKGAQKVITEYEKLNKHSSDQLWLVKVSILKTFCIFVDEDYSTCLKHVSSTLSLCKNFLDSYHLTILYLLEAQCLIKLGKPLSDDRQLDKFVGEIESHYDTMLLTSAYYLQLQSSVTKKQWPRAMTLCQKIIDTGTEEDVVKSTTHLKELIIRKK